MKDGTVIYEDKLTGYKVKFYFDDLTGDVTLKQCWPPELVNDIIERNKRIQKEGKDAYRSKTKGETDMWFAGHIPDSVIMDWYTNEGIKFWDRNHWPAIIKKLNDPEYRDLRAGLFRI